MKKAIILAFALAIVGTQTAKAVNDTTAVKYTRVVFETEQTTSKSGETKTEYYAVVDGETYTSNKTSMQRCKQIQKFGGRPCLVLITNDRNRKGRIAVL